MNPTSLQSPKFILFAVISVLFVLGCGPTTPAADGGITPTPTMACAGNTENGSNACNTQTCGAGQWCNTIICEVGCTSTANCARGDICDLRSPVEWFGKQVGTCRACPRASEPVATTCTSVIGAYQMTLSSGSSAACDRIFKPTECTFTQNGCSVSQVCVGGGLVQSINLDASNKGTYKASVVEMGNTIDVNCSYQFSLTSPKTVLIACQFTAPGQGGIVCNASGVVR